MRNKTILLMLLSLAAFPSCQTSGSDLATASGDLLQIVDGMEIVAEGSGGFAAPTEAESSTYRSALANLFAGDEESAREELESLGLEILRFHHTSGDVSGPTFLLIRETVVPSRGWGLFAINTRGSRDLILEAPHPVADQGSERQAAELFLNLSARALLIGGSHRCASPDASPCSGTTDFCDAADGPYRLSDAAHTEDQFFQVTHETLLNADSSLKAVALHGFSRQEGDPHAFVSNGTDLPFNEEALANRFTVRLEARTAATDAARSCNDGGPAARLCGTEDVQGRYANASLEACEEEATGATGRFLHIEQSGELRDGTGPVGLGDVEAVLFELF